ncbi:MAG TPA: cytidylate kinase family protein [Candidatus Baltobacteraceae bacterium]|nr:cytidylate kinase family protein [Candidatus Baltobacteraceae bacterium]
MKWITVSRKMGTHGSDIARQVASKLGYRVYDTKAINRKAEELGFLESVHDIDEKTPSLFQRVFSRRPMVYLERLYSVLYELAKQGDAVFLGRGSHLLLRDFTGALHVRVIASPATCLRTLTAQGLNPDAAARILKRTDDERRAFLRFAFGVDWDDPTRYDLVLNMDKLSVDLAVRTVVQLVRAPDFPEVPPEAVRSLDTLALTSRAEAALIEAAFGQGLVSPLSVAVVAPGTVRVSGEVETLARKAEAERILRTVRGVDAVENALQVVVLQSV